MTTEEKYGLVCALFCMFWGIFGIVLVCMDRDQGAFGYGVAFIIIGIIFLIAALHFYGVLDGFLRNKKITFGGFSGVDFEKIVKSACHIFFVGLIIIVLFIAGIYSFAEGTPAGLIFWAIDGYIIYVCSKSIQDASEDSKDNIIRTNTSAGSLEHLEEQRKIDARYGFVPTDPLQIVRKERAERELRNRTRHCSRENDRYIDLFPAKQTEEQKKLEDDLKVAWIELKKANSGQSILKYQPYYSKCCDIVVEGALNENNAQEVKTLIQGLRCRKQLITIEKISSYSLQREKIAGIDYSECMELISQVCTGNGKDGDISIVRNYINGANSKVNAAVYEKEMMEKTRLENIRKSAY